jgi:gas vesicle structural protein
MGREVAKPGTANTVGEPGAVESEEAAQLVLSDLINRVLDKGVVISGHVTISVADIDLIALDLRLLISSFEKAIAGSDTGDASSSP